MVSIDYDLLNLSMSPTVEIVDLTKKIDSQLKERVLDPNREVKDFDDVLELGMYGASEFGNHDDFKFLEQFKNIEMKLEENTAFTIMSQQMATVRQEFTQKLPSPDSPEFSKALAEINKAIAYNPTFKSLVDGQNKLREQALKLIEPTVDFSDSLKRITQITTSHQQYHVAEQERMQLEVEKSEMEMYANQLELKTLAVKSKDAVFVSDFHKQLENDIQKHIVRNKTKPKVDGGTTYKQKQKLIKVRKKYDRLLLTKSHTRAKNILMKDEAWTLRTLNKNLTKGKKLLQK